MFCRDSARLVPGGALLLLTLVLVACGGGGSGDSGGGGGGGGSTTTLTVAAAATALDTGANTTVTATLSGSGASSGVTWTLIGSGSLTNATATTVSYVAPSSLNGAEVVTVTAKSVADSTLTAAASITVNGTPVLLSPTFFPLYQNVSFSAQFVVAGGTAPFTWAITAGSLPTGITLGTATTNSNTITGTPSATGSSTFTISATDSTGRVVSNSFTLLVRQQTACLLEGNFAFMFAGFRGSDFIARGGSLAFGADGKITGVEDFADVGSNSLAASLTSGTCRTSAQNFGSNEIASSAGQATYAYAALNGLTTAYFQESDNSSARGAGELALRATAVATPPSGSFAFGLFGVDTTGDGLAVIGRASLDATGTITAGRIDVAGPGAQTAAALTGNFGAPDANGRGTATLTFASRSLKVYYYPVSTDKFYALSTDSNAPRLAGFVTRQVGAGSTVATALPSPGILSAWGAPLGAEHITALGRFTALGASTVNLVLDTARRGDAPRTDTYTNMNAAVDTDGRAVITSSDSSRRFVVYFDGPASGYVAETTGVAKFGLLEAQAVGPYPATPGGVFVSSTQFGNRSAPLLLAPQLTLNSGLITGALNATYGFDTTTGRGAGSASADYFGGTGLVLYYVNDNRLRIMGSGQRGQTPVGSAISFAQK